MLLIAIQLMLCDPASQYVSSPPNNHIQQQTINVTESVPLRLTGSLALAFSHGNYDGRASLANVYF